MAHIQYLTRIQFAAGAISLLQEELALLGMRAPLIVTDRGIVAAGLLDHVMERSGLDRSAAVFDATPENPTEAAARLAVEVFRRGRCDGVVGLGGGSAIDLAKIVSLLVTHPEPLAQYAAILGGMARITADKPPVVAVPTTAGTGSEVGRAALLTLEDGRKLGFISPHVIPSLALCDPELTLGLPPGLTAATGMDTLTHCIETYLSPRFNPVADAIALDGLHRVNRWISRAVEDGSDLEARSEMMMAALQGGLTFQKGLGAVHSLSHALGGLSELRLHHGTLNAVLLPAVLDFNHEAAGSKYAALRQAMDLLAEADLAEAVRTISVRLGLPGSLSAMGVPARCFADIADKALLDHSTATNPRPINIADFRVLLEQSFA